MMSKCVVCGAETILLVNDVPICTRCDQVRDLENLKREGQELDPPHIRGKTSSAG